MRWLSDSGNMKKASLPPSFWPWRNCPRRSSDSKRACPTPHQYGPSSQLLGASVPLLRRDYTEATHPGALYCFTCVTTERTWGSGMQNPPQVQRHKCVSCEVKQSPKGILLGKMPLQFPAVSSPHQVGSLILIPILWKGPPSHSYSKWVANSLTRIRGALPPARWRKGTTAFICRCGFSGLARQIHKSIKL